MSQALYRLWRPRDWDEVVGQEHVIQTLRNAVRSERIGHAYLFAGSRGTGKTSTARLLAKAVNCVAPDPGQRPCNVCEHCVAINQGRYLDLIEIDAASNTSVDDVRDLRDKINFSPNEGRFKVYIIDEVHMLSTAAFNALLKTLEEPPAHAIFILATTEVHKIPATVLSRCQRHEFRRIAVTTMVALLKERSESAGLEVDEDTLHLIARQATGSMRDAISLLDQLTSTGASITLSDAQAMLGTVASDAVLDLVQALVSKDIGRGLATINLAMDGGADARQFARQVVDTLRNLLLIRMGNAQLIDAPQEDRIRMEAQAGNMPLAFLMRSIKAFSDATAETRPTWIPGLILELALLDALADQDDSPGSGPAPKAAAPVHPRQNPKPAKETPTVAPGDVLPPPAETKDPSPMADADVGQVSGFALVRARWRQILQAVRAKDPRLQGLLNSCQPLGIEDGMLLLGFSSDLLREKMEKKENLRNTCAALEEVLKESLGLRCVLLSGQEPAQHNDEKLAAIKEDGMVATAVRDLGAQVVEVEPVNRRGSA